jgi:hypothetical protein
VHHKQLMKPACDVQMAKGNPWKLIISGFSEHSVNYDGDITSMGQNVRRDKTAGRRKRPEDQTSGRTKRPEGQNVWRHTYKKRPKGQTAETQHSLCLFSISNTYIFFFTQAIVYSLSTVYLTDVIVGILTVLLNIKDLC